MKDALIAMLALIGVMFAVAFISRMYAVASGAVNMNHYKVFAEKTAPEYDTRITNNLNNQFQLPMLFVAAAVLVIARGLETPELVFSAWAFVICRVAHALVHVCVNIVLLRASVFAAGAYFLGDIWWQIYWSL